MASGSWLLTTGGAWNNNANWSAAFPNALTDTATIATDLTTDQTITLGQAISVGSMTFSDNGASGNAWTIAPGGAFALTLGTSTITTTTNVTISAAVAGSAAVTKAGNATLTLSGGGTNTGAWAVNAGTLAVTTAALIGTTGTITVASGATLTSSANITKPIVILNGATATLNANTAALDITGTGVTFGSGTTSTAGVVRFGVTGANKTVVTLPAGRTITPATFETNASTSTTDVAIYQEGASVSCGSGAYSYLNSGAANNSYGYWNLQSGSMSVPQWIVLGAGGTTSNIINSVFELRNTGTFTGRLGLGEYGNGDRALHFQTTNQTFSALQIGYRTTSDRRTYTSIDNVTVSTGIEFWETPSANNQMNVAVRGASGVLSGAPAGTGTGVLSLVDGATYRFSGTHPSTVSIVQFGANNKFGTTSTATLSNVIPATTSVIGITGFTLSNNGTGYIGAPVVKITGGGGTGAVARAEWNKITGQIDSITVISPGSGYTSTPTVTLVGGGYTTQAVATAATGSVTTQASFEKVDSGTLTLTGTHTYTGTTTVSAGTLQIGAGSTAGSIDSSSGVTIAANSNFYYNRSDAKTWTLPVTATATSAFGVNSTGTMTLSAGWLNTNNYTGSLYIGSTGGITVNESVDRTLAGLSGAGAGTFTKNGSGKLTFNTTSDNAAAWAINAGTVDVTAAQTRTTGTITVANGAALTVGASISKPIVLNGTCTATSGTTSGTLTVGFDSNIAKLLISGAGTSVTPNTGSAMAVSAATGSRAVVYQTGGTFGATATDPTTNRFNFGYTNGAANYAYYKGTSGIVSAPYLLVSTNNYNIVDGIGAPAIMDFAGATLSLTGVTPYTFGATGSSNGNTVLNFIGGTHTAGTGSYWIWSTLSTQKAILSVSDGALLTQTGALISQGTGTAALILNIIGATSKLQVGGFSFSNSGTKTINLNSGGTLAVTAASILSGGTSAVVLYGTGNKLSASSANIALPLSVIESTGSGVSSIGINSTGSGYIGAPFVNISGDGSGATARAVVDLEAASPTYGQITAIVVTCPGVGYTTASATLSGGSPTVAATVSTPTLVGNTTDGAVTKIDSGTLVLTGTNTYTGTTTVSQGTLRIGNSSAAGTLGNNDTSNVSVASGATLAFGRSDARTYSSIISGAGTIAVNGGVAGSRATLSGVNTFTSAAAAISIAANSALRVTNSDSIGQGTSFGVTVISTGAFEIDGTSGAITGLPAKALSLAGTGISSGGALRNIAGNNTYSGPITLASAAQINSDAGTLTLNSATAIAGAALTFGGAGTVSVQSRLNLGAANSVSKVGAGLADIANELSTNTMNNVSITAGTYGFRAVSALGAGTLSITSAATAAAAGGLRFTGTTPTTVGKNISIPANLAVAAIRLEASGSAALTYNGTISSATTNYARTYQLGGDSTADNTLATTLVNVGATGAVGIVKADTGTWVLTNTGNTYSGGTTVNAGTLKLSIATWATGAKVTGTGTVTVGTTGKIQTLKGTTQNGRHTYNNLTFSAGGRIRIGG